MNPFPLSKGGQDQDSDPVCGPPHPRCGCGGRRGVPRILVENEDGLYITKDFLVTHNTVSFGNVYGQSVSAMAQQLGISREEAQQIRDMYFARFPQARQVLLRINMNSWRVPPKFVHGWVGRLLSWEQMHSDRGVRSKAARMSVNIPVQGRCNWRLH